MVSIDTKHQTFSAPPSHRGTKVLLADDEPIGRTMIQHWLAGWGYQVICAKDGAEALEKLQTDSEIRLAIVDWVMPKHDGIDVCHIVRQAPEDAYVYMILLTAKDDKHDIVQGLDAGADDYLVKPCNPLELRVRLRAGRRLIDLQTQLIRARNALQVEAMTDSLTRLLNRGALLAQLDRELARVNRSTQPLSVVMVDLDHFKTINDKHGHAAGDAVLREASDRLQQHVRGYDFLGRLGGEEFLIVLPGCSLARTLPIAERLKMALADRPIATSDSELRVTASFGVASTEQFASASASELIQVADRALYRAKAAGRNAVCVAQAPDFNAVRAGDNQPSKPISAA